MTAAAGVLTGLAKLKRQDSARSQNRPVPASPGLGAPAPEAAPRKRKRRTDVVVVRGRLRLYSASGFFLLLGLVILAIGIGMATLGYWPQSEAMHPAKTRTGGGPDPANATAANATAANATAANASAFNNIQATPSKQTGGALARFLEQHRHSERMKMLGPFTMGIGIFIFICANAILHENRDRETKIIHMRDMYSTVIDIHRLRQKEHKLQQHHQYQHQRHRSSTFSRDGPAVDVRAFGLESAARLAGNSLLSFSRAASVGGGGAEEELEEEAVVLLGGGEEEEELCRQREQARLDCGLAGLLAPLYKDRPFYGQQGRSHHYHLHQQHHHQWSVDSDGGGGHHARSIVSSSISAFTLPVIKLNNCVIDEPEMEAITEEERGGGDKGDPERRGMAAGLMESLAVPAPSLAKASKPPGLHRSNSASSSDSSCCSPASPSPSPTSACWLSPGAARTDSGSNSSLHGLGGHSKSLDLERGPGTLSVRPEQRKHPSWPRLDRSNSSGAGAGSGKGYVRLQDREDHGEGGLLDVTPCAASRRDYSKREKLLMISRSHNNLTFEHDDFNSGVLKRGSSETRF